MAASGERCARYTHGQTGTTLHNRWKAMKQRCYYPGCSRYKDYGGRGIGVCEEWQTFEPFAEWARGNGFHPDLQLDRIDNDGPYSPENCQWVTPAQNGRNRRDSRRYSFFGEEMVITDAAKRYGVSVAAITKRIGKGFTPEQAVTMPLRPGKAMPCPQPTTN